MTALDAIRFRVQKRFNTNPNIHISVSLNRPKVNVSYQEARISGVYPHIFQIEAQGKRYTLQYADILTKNIFIAELEDI